MLLGVWLIVARAPICHTTGDMGAIARAALLFAISGVLSAGCANRATSSSEAIQHAKTLRTAKQQADYLVAQAKEFLGVKDYQEAVKTTQYVLASIDVNSQPAKEVLEEAKQQLARDTQAVVRETEPHIGL